MHNRRAQPRPGCSAWRPDRWESMQRTDLDAAEVVIEFAEHLYRADLYAIEVTVYSR